MSRLYHFECPVCEFSDSEAGSYATEEQIYCGMCAEDNEVHIRLHRWPVENDKDDLHSPKIANI